MGAATGKHGKASSDTGANSLTISWTGGGSSTAGSAIGAACSWFNSGGGVTDCSSVTDSTGTNAYTIAKTLDINATGVYVVAAYTKNAAAASSVTFHFTSTAPAFFRAFIFETTGADTSNPLNASDSHFQVAPGTGANAVTSQSGSTATTVDGCVVYGMVFDITIDQTPQVGTSPLSFTSLEGMNSPDNDGELLEAATQTTHGTTAATAQLANAGSTVGTIMMAFAPPSGAISLTGQTVTSSEGTVSRAVSYALTGQTATFTEGTITANTGGNVSKSLTAQTATFSEGSLSVNIGYTLNDGVPLTGQTATFAEGSPSQSISYTLGSQSATFTEGSLATELVSYSVTGQTATFTEGTITTPGNVMKSLTGQTITSSEGVLGPAIANALTGQSITSSEGTIAEAIGVGLVGQLVTLSEGVITASATGNVTRSLTGFSASFTLGVISSSGGITPKNVMPNLIGLNYSEAQASLAQAGILVTSSIGYFGTFPITAVWRFANGITPGVVTAQSIPPGTPSVPVNAPITLTLSEFPLGVASP